MLGGKRVYGCIAFRKISSWRCD